MKREKRRRILVTIIAFILIFMMIVPLLLQMTVYAETLDYVVANEDDYNAYNEESYDDSYDESYDDSYDESYDDSYDESYDESYDDSADETNDESYNESEEDTDIEENQKETDEKSTSEDVNTVSESGKDVCAEGIYIENINVAGMSRSQVEHVVENKMKELSAEQIYLYTEMGSTTVTAGALGLNYQNREIVDQALAIGRKGNVLKRFKADTYLKSHGQIVLDLDLEVDRTTVKDRVEAEKTVLNIAPIAVGIHLEADGTMTSTEASDGIEVIQAKSIDRIIDYMGRDWHGGTGGVNLCTKILKPEEHKGDLTLVKDVLGSATTDYAGGAAGRLHNIEYAASIIDGTIVDPGEIFDFSATVGEQNEENGWAAAGSLEDGKAVETYGGGICQVSTTLYQSVLYSELEIEERYPHSMEVTYVEPGMDAAIADNIKNFRFSNNTDTPIYINAIADGGRLTFNIYGHETRDPSRSITIESRIVSEEEYNTAATLDSSQAGGTVSFSGGQRGLVTETWKTIYINGVQESEELVNTSIYEMLPLTYIIGTDGLDDGTISALASAVQSGNTQEALGILGW